MCDRWAKNKTDNLQAAFFNGDGYAAWENVWGSFNQITERDGEAIRRVASILRFFGKQGYTSSPQWVPHIPTLQHSVFGSQFPHPDAAKRDTEVLYTFVNRVGSDVSGPQIRLNAAHTPHAVATAAPGMRYYDVYRGVEITPSVDRSADVAATTP